MVEKQSDASESPYISFVAASRNDNHGGDLLRRMNLFISSLVEQCKRYQISAELVLVEWNPPRERPPLLEVLDWPTDLGPCQIRIVEVPPEIHHRFKHAQALPLYQMIAKNVGVRRARGEFVVATNIDIIFSDALFQKFATRQLKSGCLYRVDRYDVLKHVPYEASMEERLAFCEDPTNLIRICQKDGTFVVENGHKDVIFPPLWKMRAKAEVMNIAKFSGIPFFRAQAEHYRDLFKQHLNIGRMHTNACGDFTLLSREDWERLHGYAEWEMYSFHIDSLFLHQAFGADIKEVVLRTPCRIFHIEHSEGSGWTPENQDQLWLRLERQKIERLSDEELWQHVTALRKKERAPQYADENWGLAEESLRETVIEPSVKRPADAALAKPPSARLSAAE